MDFELTANEARVLGVLIEKESTTPDVYPLSVNAITGGCNQKSNREPVMTLSEGDVRDALDGLIRATLVREQGSAGGRVQRYGHRLASRLFGKMELSEPERAALCVLLLRGPQTPGEIRSRAHRLFAFDSIEQVEQTLRALAEHADGPFVRALPREPGRRELRYAHLLCGAPAASSPPQAESVAPPAPSVGVSSAAPAPAADASALERLERRLESAEARIQRLEERLDALS